MRLKTFQNLRKTISFTAAIFLIMILLFTESTWKADTFLGIILETSGLLFMLIATTGRIYSSLFISGHKSNKIVDVGPYSIVRNPLYFFSFIGVIGLGLCSQNIFFLFVSIITFVFFYSFVIRAEEAGLFKKFGNEFTDYMLRVPMIIPSFKNPKFPDYYEIDIKRIGRAFLDAIGLWGAYSVLHIMNYLHWKQILPIQ